MSSGGPEAAPTTSSNSTSQVPASRTSPPETTSGDSQNIRHKMRPPGLACLKNARNFDDSNKMSKKEKRFDPARAPLPTRMPEYFNVNLIQSQLPHQPQSYLISKLTSCRESDQLIVHFNGW